MIRVPIAAAVTAALVMLFASPAVAGSTDSGWDRFLDWTYGGVRHCAAQRSTVWTQPGVLPPVEGISWVRHRQGDDCHADKVPVGWLGVQGYVQRADGYVCASEDWNYNWYDADTWSVSIDSYCSYNYISTVGQARIYRPHFGGYSTSPWLSSPYASYPL